MTKNVEIHHGKRPTFHCVQEFCEKDNKCDEKGGISTW